jgi:hypothetical protein
VFVLGGLSERCADGMSSCPTKFPVLGSEATDRRGKEDRSVRHHMHARVEIVVRREG